MHTIQLSLTILPHKTIFYSPCLHAWQPGAISPKSLCPAVVIRMREIFLLQKTDRQRNHDSSFQPSDFLSCGGLLRRRLVSFYKEPRDLQIKWLSC